MMPVDQGLRPRLQRICSRRPVGDAAYNEVFLMVTLRTAKRLQRILTYYVRVIPGCVFRN